LLQDLHAGLFIKATCLFVRRSCMQRKPLWHLIQTAIEKRSTQTTSNLAGQHEDLIQYCFLELDRGKSNNGVV